MDIMMFEFRVSAFAILVASFLLYCLRHVLKLGHRDARLPPENLLKQLPKGPPTLPIVGNEYMVPKSNAHFRFSDWAKEYGGIFSLKRYTNTTIIITNRELVKELLDKKSSVYSHRPASHVGDLITSGNHLLLMQYSNDWRAVRKLIHQYFMESMCEKQHVKLVDAEATQLMHDFLLAPEDNMFHPKRYSNSIINALVFAIRSKTHESPYLRRLFSLMEEWSEILELGATPPVDSFPLLKLVPERLLGNWRSRAVRVGNLMTDLYTEVLGQLEQRRSRGINRGSFMDRVYDQQEKLGLTKAQCFFLGGVLMEGGSDTSSSLILAMIQAMMEFPEVQKRAQTEIDANIPEDRSPTWADFDKLPYINMMIKEAHRWRPVSPLGVSHATAEGKFQKYDWINGMFIPKGATVVMNVWGMHHDPTHWENPDDFMPERFLSHPKLASTYTSDGPQRDHFGYGFGRRVCPGIHLAERNLFIAMAKLLWAFRYYRKSGMVVDSSAETGSSKGFLQCVKDYSLGIEARSEKRVETIRRELAEAQSVFAEYD